MNAKEIAGLPPRIAGFYLGLVLVVLLLYPILWSGAPYLDADSDDFLSIAADLRDFDLSQLPSRPLGYPLLALLTGSTREGTRALFIVQLLLHSISVWIMAVILYKLASPLWAVKLFGVLSILPPFTEPAAKVMTENLTQFLLISGFGFTLLAVHRRKAIYYLFSGLLFGFCAVVRPTYILTSLAAVASLMFLSWVMKNKYLLWKHAIKAALITVPVSSLVILCFAGYNFFRHNAFGLSWGGSSLAGALTTKTVRVLERLPDEYATERELLIAARDRSLIARGSSHTGNQYWFAARQELARETGKSPAEFQKQMLRINILLIQKAPLNYLLDVLQVIPGFWFPSASKLTYTERPFVRIVWTLFHFAWISLFGLQLIVILGLSMIAMTRRLTHSPSKRTGHNLILSELELTSYLIALVLISYTMIVSCVLNVGAARYRIPVDLLIMFLCLVGTRIWWRLAHGCSETPIPFH